MPFLEHRSVLRTLCDKRLRVDGPDSAYVYTPFRVLVVSETDLIRQDECQTGLAPDHLLITDSWAPYAPKKDERHQADEMSRTR